MIGAIFFHKMKVWSLESRYSDHLSIFLNPDPVIHIPRSNQFPFENVWLREANCMDIVPSSLVSFAGSLIQIKLSMCGTDLLK